MNTPKKAFESIPCSHHFSKELTIKTSLQRFTPTSLFIYQDAKRQKNEIEKRKK